MAYNRYYLDKILTQDDFGLFPVGKLNKILSDHLKNRQETPGVNVFENEVIIQWMTGFKQRLRGEVWKHNYLVKVPEITHCKTVQK